MSFRLDFSPEENYYSFNHNQMTIFKWLHLAFSFGELMQKNLFPPQHELYIRAFHILNDFPELLNLDDVSKYSSILK